MIVHTVYAISISVVLAIVAVLASLAIATTSLPRIKNDLERCRGAALAQGSRQTSAARTTFTADEAGMNLWQES